MTELEKAARQALEALMRSKNAVSEDYDLASCAYGSVDPDGHRYQDAKKAVKSVKEAITALRRALEQQPADEPVAWMVTTEMQDGTRQTYLLTGRYKDVLDTCDFGSPIPLYTTPQLAAAPEKGNQS